MDAEARPKKKARRSKKGSRQGKKAAHSFSDPARLKAPVPGKKAEQSSGDPTGLTTLALRLANTFCSESSKNTIFSPLSIYTALGLVAAGARGKTLDELLAVLGASSREEVAELVGGVAERALAADRSGPLIVTSVCSVWHQEGLALKRAYRNASVESYKAEARAVDFKADPEGAREEINRWVTEATNELITTLLPGGSVHRKIKLVLANAVYFKGNWEDRFHKSLTQDAEFYRLDGSTVNVPFMTAGRPRPTRENYFREEKKVEYFVAYYDGFKVLKLPYARAANGARYSMCVFLPDARDGLPSLADKMASGGMGFLFDHLPNYRRSVRKLLLPRFKLSYYCSMKKALKNLGLQKAFSEEADLSDMVENSDRGMKLQVEDVFHKAVIEVNEEGTVAAASFAGTMRLYSYTKYVPVDFVADHPFAFFIVEEVSRAMIFAGHVFDPSKHSE